jgi:dienelactone hydrolase
MFIDGVLRKRGLSGRRFGLVVGVVVVLGSTAVPVGLVAADGVSDKPTSTSSRAATAAPVDRFVATELPASPAGRQVRWLIEASARLPLSGAELRAHVTKAALSSPGGSPAEVNGFLRTLGALRLVGLTLVRPDGLAAIVTGRDARELVLTVVVDHDGLIGSATIDPAVGGSGVALPEPSGRAVVGMDVVQLVDRARGGRRLMLTRWYPAATGARERPLAAYASPRLTAVLGLPPVRVHARTRARARRGRLPVVLFSPGWGVSRVIYQALAEDLASHGYLVIAVDHTGETPVEFPDGRIRLPSVEGPKDPLATASATRLADMRLVLRRLNTMATGPLADRRRVAAIGHSLGGSTAADLMLAEPSLRAGVDLDGAIIGNAARRGVPRAFMVMGAGKGHLAQPGWRAVFRRWRGPLLALEVEGFEHMSFSDLPAFGPEAQGVGKRPSPRDISMQSAYVRAFLGRHLLDRPSPLLDGPSRRFPRVSLKHRGR